MKKTEKIIVVLFTLVFVFMGLIGLVYSQEEFKYKGVIMAGTIGLMMWFKWTELELEGQKK